MKINRLKGDIMTKKLYEKDPYKTSFEAKVISVNEKNGKYHVVLDNTYFYPEGGGQPADTGKVDGVNVLDVLKTDSNIVHILDQDLPEGKKVDCNIDWKRRYDFMQQHTGQHLLSAILKNEYDINTVGFTLSENTLRIDTDKKISDKQLKNIEYKVNSLIQEGIDIKSVYPDKNQLEKLTLRKEPTVNQNIRVIQIGEVDYSPCGGTHLNYTYELGIIKITDTANYKGGLRIDFVCGNRALADYDNKNDTINKMKNILSVPIEKILYKINSIKKNLSESEKTINDLKDKILNYESEMLLKEAITIGKYKVIKKIFKDKSFNEVQYLANILIDKNNNVCIFGQCDESTARLLIFRSDNIDFIDANELIKTSLSKINGNGGGNRLKAQGGGNNIKGIDEAVENIFKKVNSIL